MELGSMYLRQVAKERLNPCFNGIQMEPMLISSSKMGLMCLNPCYNGIKMKANYGPTFIELGACLNPCYNGIKMKAISTRTPVSGMNVLILVIMEH